MNLQDRSQSQFRNAIADERMYLDHFELKEAPFSITPDPRFVYLTAQHRDALAHLLFGITQGGGGGFVQLTGEVGTGKTTLCRLLMAQVPENVRIALVLNPMLQPIELLRSICDELRILLPKRNASIKVLTDALTRYLLESYAAGLRVVLIVDEAQNLSFEAFEQVRMLTNLETPTQKLLQIILLGQPELRDLLARNELRQLAQRITARFHLAPLSVEDTSHYVEHRLAVAGRKRRLFTTDALRELYRRTQGFPRAINVVADRALLGAYARELDHVDASLVRIAATEVSGAMGGTGHRRRSIPVLIGAMLATIVGALGFAVWQPRTPNPIVIATTPAAPRPERSLRPPTGFSDAGTAAGVLAGWWGAPGRTDITQCGSHRPDEALCATLRLNAVMLRSLDRPVVLELRGPDHSEWLALRRLDADMAQVAGPQQLGDRPWQVVEARWLGDALLVVKPPERYDGTLLAKGAEGDVVRAIHAALAIFDGEGAVDVRRFDDDTARRVHALQRHYGLGADGVVGPETLALLMAFQSAGPRLSDGRDPEAFVSVPQR